MSNRSPSADQTLRILYVETALWVSESSTEEPAPVAKDAARAVATPAETARHEPSAMRNAPDRYGLWILRM
jgi:hypothetical protein